jgi:hypothetical protein
MTIPESIRALHEAINDRKPNDRSSVDRGFAVVLAKLEEAEALASFHGVDQPEVPATPDLKSERVGDG